MKEYMQFAKEIILRRKSIMEIIRDYDDEEVKEHYIKMAEADINDVLKLHTFEMNKITKKMLMMTSSPKNNMEIKLPFDDMFISVTFSSSDLKKNGVKKDADVDLIGIRIKKFTAEGIVSLLGEKFRDVDDMFLIETLVRTKTGVVGIDGFGFDKESQRIDEDLDEMMYPNEKEMVERGSLVPKNEQYHKFLMGFIINFLNLLNDPDIIVKEKIAGKKKQIKRKEKGKIPIPKRGIIRLDGRLKVYADKIQKEKRTWKYSHRFWVRGHWRRLRAERYGKNQGKRIWIPPYVKGNGILIEKEYVVEKK